MENKYTESFLNKNMTATRLILDCLKFNNIEYKVSLSDLSSCCLIIGMWIKIPPEDLKKIMDSIALAYRKTYEAEYGK